MKRVYDESSTNDLDHLAEDYDSNALCKKSVWPGKWVEGNRQMHSVCVACREEWRSSAPQRTANA